MGAAGHVDEVADCLDNHVVGVQGQENMEDGLVGLEADSGIAVGRCSVGYSEPSADADIGWRLARRDL